MQDVKVAYTSVAPAGFGLYAMRDFKEGEFLPVYYNGLTISDKEANRMEDYILAMSNAVPGPTKKQIQELKDRWGIDIALNGSRDELGTWDYKGPEHEINWNRLYDNYFDYAFGYYDPDIKKNLHVYWSDYNYTGEPTIDHLVAENAALFVNEPPDADYYYNQLLQEYMPVNSNLESTYNPKLKKLGLKTTRPVLAGEEFFLCYGVSR